jgi:serine-type D-Ala-D-Ala carboxypeptidase/endopeptidase
MLSLLNCRVAAWSLGLCFMTTMSAKAGLLPERVEKAAQERIAAGTYQTLAFGVVEGDKSEVVAFGKLEGGKTPDGDTVYEIGSVTKTFTATLLAQAVLSGRVTLDTPVAQLLPDFKIPSHGGKEITLSDLATQHSGLPRMPSNFLPKDPANPFADYDARSRSESPDQLWRRRRWLVREEGCAPTPGNVSDRGHCAARARRLRAQAPNDVTFEVDKTGTPVAPL